MCTLSISHRETREEKFQGSFQGCDAADLQEMSEEFSQLEATLTEAARQGNIAHVIALLRDTGRLHHLWQVHIAAHAIRVFLGCHAGWHLILV